MKITLILIAITLQAEDYTFVIDSGGKIQRDNAGRAAQRFTPCSTFKFPNGLIGVDTGVIGGADWVQKWDAQRDPKVPGREEWARDHDFRSAMKYSVVWFFRAVARSIGAERMQDYLRRFDYGNQDISGGIDRFWINSSLRISANEQVAFLRKLNEGKLPVSSRAVSVVKDVLVLEEGDGYRWRGKTGACGATAKEPAVTWHVGFVERKGTVAYYALNLGGSDLGPLMERRNQLIRELLAREKLLPLKKP